MWQYAMITTAVFGLLKLTGVISWDWIWVCSPAWGLALFNLACNSIYYATRWIDGRMNGGRK